MMLLHFQLPARFKDYLRNTHYMFFYPHVIHLSSTSSGWMQETLLKPAGIRLLLKTNLGLSQSEASHAGSDPEKTDTTMTSVSAESALCYRYHDPFPAVSCCFSLTEVDVKSVKTSTWSVCNICLT